MSYVIGHYFIDKLHFTSWLPSWRYNTKGYVINSIIGSSRRLWLTLSAATPCEVDCKPRIVIFAACRCRKRRGVKWTSASAIFGLSIGLKAQCHLLSDVILSAWNLKKFTNFFKFVIFVGKGWCFIIWLNTAYYTTKVSVINTQSPIYINLLK